MLYGCLVWTRIRHWQRQLASEISQQQGGVRYWHLADMTVGQLNVRFWG